MAFIILKVYQHVYNIHLEGSYLNNFKLGLRHQVHLYTLGQKYLEAELKVDKKHSKCKGLYFRRESQYRKYFS